MRDNIVEYDVRLRGAGKTYDLVEWWRERPGSRIIVVPDNAQAQWVLKTVRGEHNVPVDVAKADKFVSFDQLRAGRLLRGRADVEVAIDNLDGILARMLPPNALLHRVSTLGLLADATLREVHRGGAAGTPYCSFCGARVGRFAAGDRDLGLPQPHAEDCPLRSTVQP